MNYNRNYLKNSLFLHFILHNMTAIQTQDYTIYFNQKSYDNLNQQINNKNYSSIFILTDSNTNKHCSSQLLANINTDIRIEILEIEPGEQHKNLDTCSSLWKALSELGADRKSLMINLGGGVVTDLGGFVACCYQRGIDFINIPTTLLSMVDASIGGKNGVDLGALKNQIGIIKTPVMVIIDTSFLNSLPQRDLRSGLAEMIKHGLISNPKHYSDLQNLSNLTLEDLDWLIYDSINVKKEIVEKDPTEQNLRKTLNFGHTLGHAIESYYLNQVDKALLHGEAIAIGMVLESFLSHKILGLDINSVEKIKSFLIKTFGQPKIDPKDFEGIIGLMKHDKKNENGKIKFVLLENIGTCKINQEAPNDLVIKSFEFYNN